MRANKLILLLGAIFLGLAIKSASAVTFPSGTVFTVKTLDTISSRDIAGKPFRAQLLEDIPGRNGLRVAAGLGVAGVVQSTRVEVGSMVQPLTLILTGFNFEGRLVPIVTQPYEVSNAGIMGGRGGNIRFTGGGFILPPGTVLQFRLRRSFTI